MSRVSNVLKMLVLLRARKKMKAQEIADELEVKVRMVQKYRQDLQMAGIQIESESGTSGGYSLPSGYDYLLHLGLGLEEQMALDMAAEQLLAGGFVHTKELSEAMNKIRIAYSKSQGSRTSSEALVLFGSKASQANNQVDVERQHWKEIHTALMNRKKINITYYALSKDQVENRTIQPYALYEYRNALYVTGFCEIRNEIRDFKLSRIRQVQKSQSRYEIPIDFCLKGYMENCLGIFKDEALRVSLKISHPMSEIVKEKLWEEHQNIQDVEENGQKYIIFEATLKGLVEIKSWVLSMGSSVEVLEPQSLRLSIRDELEKMLKNF